MRALRRRSLPPVLGQQICRRGLPAHGQMVPVLGSKLWNDGFKQPSFPAVVWPKRSIVNIADVITSVCSNIDGSIGLMSRIRDVIMSSQQGDLKMQFLAFSVCTFVFVWNFGCVGECNRKFPIPPGETVSVKTRIQLLEKARDLLRDLKEKEPSDELIPKVEERAKELMHTATDLQQECEQSKVRKVLSASKLSHLKAEVWDISFYALMLNMLTSPPPSGGRGGSTMHCRIVGGLPIVSTNDPGQVEMLIIALNDVPKVWKPILQPVGDAVARLPGIQETFSHVLPAVAADADWNFLPDPDTTTLQNIKLEREDELTKDFGCEDAGGGEISDEDVPGQGSVRRLRSDQVPYFRVVASDKGNIHVARRNELFCQDVSGFAVMDGVLPHWPGGLAVSGNTLAATVGNNLWVGERILARKLQNKFEKLGIAGSLNDWLGGVSMNESYVYFCLGHSVQCLDLATRSIFRVMGDQGKEGCGGVENAAKHVLLCNPRDTALVGTSLFVADYGNRRVLCYDMKTNKCRIIFEGKRPLRLAADHGNLFIYDTDQPKIFHVDLDTWPWRAEHVLGTGITGHSPEGLPPLSTHLGKICSMAVGHGGELVYIEDERLVHAFKMAPKADPRALCAKKVALFQEVTYGAEWRVFCPKTVPMPMFASEILPEMSRA